MLFDVFCGVTAAASSIYVLCIMMELVQFLSHLKYPVNDTDATTFSLFTIDACLVVLFMALHSGLASVTYRRTMDDWGLTPLARTVYVFLSAAMLKLLMYQWQPIPEVHFWLIDLSDSPLLALFFTAIHVVLWGILFLQVLLLEPLHFIGLKQVYYYIKDWQAPQSYLGTRLRLLLAQMPHVGASCFIAILWIQPYMTFDRMILATVFTAYLCGSFSLTEKDYEYVKQCSWATSTVQYKSYKSIRLR